MDWQQIIMANSSITLAHGGKPKHHGNLNIILTLEHVRTEVNTHIILISKKEGTSLTHKH
jgi:hypothetical protein